MLLTDTYRESFGYVPAYLKDRLSYIASPEYEEDKSQAD